MIVRSSPIDDLEVTLLNEATQLTMQADVLTYCVLKEDVVVIVPHYFVQSRASSHRQTYGDRHRLWPPLIFAIFYINLFLILCFGAKKRFVWPIALKKQSNYMALNFLCFKFMPFYMINCAY
jgi:hypothetical protein